MRKIVYIAVLAVSGFVSVSCDTEGVTEDVARSTQFIPARDTQSYMQKDEDTTTVGGPGDDIIPIKPPTP